MSQPSLFLSHGAPDLPLHPSAARDFFRSLASRLILPRAILCISAHWLSSSPRLSAAPQPRTLYDFFGFPAELYQLTYPAPGSPELAAQVAERLNQAGWNATLDPQRGLDHGAWNPLLLIYPEAQIPVVQLTVQPQQDPHYHYQLGRILAPLREENILILASGGLTHNLAEFRHHHRDAPPPPWVREFAAWMQTALEQARLEDLLDYRQRAPYGVENHPTPEHLLPLFVALGAGGNGRLLHASTSYGVLHMGAFGFGDWSQLEALTAPQPCLCQR